MKNLLRYLLSVSFGALLGIFFHYVLYLFGLRGEPFIYFSF